MSLIDDWLPEFDVRKRYDAAVAAVPERALDLVLAAPVAPDRIVESLLALRGMPARGRTVEEYLRALDFEHLGRTPTEWAAALERDGVQRPLGEPELISGRLCRGDPLFDIQPFARIAPAGQ